MAAAAPARFLTVDDEFDALDSFDAEVLPGAKLREGMVLVDPELGTPLLLLDHRTAKGGRWLVLDCETRRYVERTLNARHACYPAALRRRG